jgi:hypothetical protein
MHGGNGICIYNLLVNLKESGHMGYRHRWEDNMNMDLTGIACEGVA